MQSGIIDIEYLTLLTVTLESAQAGNEVDQMMRTLTAHTDRCSSHFSQLSIAETPHRQFTPQFNPSQPIADRLDRTDQLARTVIYNVNPSHNELVATMLGNFQDGSIPGKMQMGSGWWFLDQKDGMERQMEALSQMGLLRRFVGMVTDSRSFLSYARHEYFRRILCNILGRDMEKGLIPYDLELVGAMVRDIAYHNAAAYFGFDLPGAGAL